MEIIDFRTFFTVTSQQFSLLKLNCYFGVPLNISDQIHMISCPKLLYFLEKLQKVFKNKTQGCCTPLSKFYLQTATRIAMLLIFRAFQQFIATALFRS